MIQPLKNKFIVQIDEVETVTETGIILDADAIRRDAKCQTGKILAVGFGVQEVLPLGQKIIFGLGDGIKLNPEYCDGRKNCILLAESLVRGIINA